MVILSEPEHSSQPWVLQGVYSAKKRRPRTKKQNKKNAGRSEGQWDPKRSPLEASQVSHQPWIELEKQHINRDHECFILGWFEHRFPVSWCVQNICAVLKTTQLVTHWENKKTCPTRSVNLISDVTVKTWWETFSNSLADDIKPFSQSILHRRVQLELLHSVLILFTFGGLAGDHWSSLILAISFSLPFVQVSLPHKYLNKRKLVGLYPPTGGSLWHVVTIYCISKDSHCLINHLSQVKVQTYQCTSLPTQYQGGLQIIKKKVCRTPRLLKDPTWVVQLFFV